jgi:hypothetical protein
LSLRSFGFCLPSFGFGLRFVVSATFFVAAGLKTFVVSSTASSTLAILLFLGVAAEAFCTFGSVASIEGSEFLALALFF